MSTLWSGRFAEEPDREVFEWGASFRFDRRLFEDDVVGSLAWVDGLEAARAISPSDAAVIRSGLQQILEEGRRDPSAVSGPDEDIHSYVERRLVELVGEPGKRLHTGRSRNEQVSVDVRLYLRRRIPEVQRAVVGLAAAVLGQAEGAGDAAIPAYTHLRRAQPVLVAHFWLAHAAALRRDYDRLRRARAEADALPLGSGALAGTTYAIDTAVLAERLGFSRVVLNSLDAASDRDFIAEFLHAVALAMIHLSRLAEDLIIFGGEEFGFFELDDRFTTGSSLMPQKKNPDPLELVRGKTGRAIGALTSLLVTMKGLPSGFNKDLQEDKEALFDAEDTLLGSLHATTAIVGTLTLNRERAAAGAGGFMLATDVADYLVARGMPFRTAHEVVGEIVRRLVTDGRAFSSLTLDEWRTFSPLFDEDVGAILAPAVSIGAKRTPQSTHPSAVATSLRAAREWVDSARVDLAPR